MSADPGIHPDAAPAMPLRKARSLADRVAELLAPHCARIEVAGSIRRECAECADIDLVAEPHPGADLELRKAFHACARGPRGQILTDGPWSKRVLLRESGVQCDLWIARPRFRELWETVPGNWGMLLLTYTGSAGHNKMLAAKAREHGWRWSVSQGLCIMPPDKGSVRVVSETEEEIFEELGIPFVPPPLRLPPPEPPRHDPGRAPWIDEFLEEPPF